MFNLPETEDNGLPSTLPENAVEITTTALTNLEKIDNSLPQVLGLEQADSELDELADLATSSYKDLQNLGMQVESRFSSEIFNAAGTMLGHAITAKTAKISKKLKMIELQLKKATLDQKQADKDKDLESTPVGNGQALDRNELLKLLSGKKSEE